MDLEEKSLYDVLFGKMNLIEKVDVEGICKPKYSVAQLNDYEPVA